MDRRVGVIDADEASTPTPFRSQWFDSSVGFVHYIDEGPSRAGARSLLLLHGNPDWRSSAVDLIRGLRSRFRCVAVDYPGFGASVHPSGYGYTVSEHAMVVRELVAALGLWDVVVVGRDWGGPIGLELASRVPERVSGLVMGETWYWAREGRTLNATAITGDTLPMGWFDRHGHEFESMRRAVSPFHAELSARIAQQLSSVPLLLVGDGAPRWHEDFHNARSIHRTELAAEIIATF